MLRHQDARTRAAATRAEADELRALPIGVAARRIQAGRAAEEDARQVAPNERDDSTIRTTTTPTVAIRIVTGQHAAGSPVNL